MDVLLFISLIGTIILVGFLGNAFFSKTNIPNTLWLLLFGLVLGYSGLFNKMDLLSISQFVGAIAVIIILSDGGMKLNLKTIYKQAQKGVILMLVGVIFSIIIATLAMMFFGYPLEYGLLMGLIIAGTSSSVVIPTITKLKGIKDETKSLLSFESISDTFTIVIALILINLIGFNALAFDSGLNTIFTSFLSAIAIGIISGLFLAPLIYKARKMEFHYSLTLAMLFLIYAFAESINASGAIAVFTAGIMFANSESILKTVIPEKIISWEQEVSTTHSLISFFIRTFFFVFLGAIVSFTDIKGIIIGIIIALGLVLTRYFYVRAVTIGQKLPVFDKNVMTAMIPRGLSAAVLATIPFSKGIAGTQIFVDIVFTIIIASVLITTLGITLAQNKLKKEQIKKPKDEEALTEMKITEEKPKQK